MRALIRSQIYRSRSNRDLLEYDVVVSIPPKRRYSVMLDVISIRKAEPKIVEPEFI